ncbi:2OG-Fe(II) oxygenase [Streptomyces sp. RerS4]|uniref:2OG-Fe(II) oxygenase n=1 Tax=Streptomyces sp. RerS4 TaxID=2942449 RepID=UPI00201BDFFF|nr:2OG-Fe(II) oxygenase [Streptomyces sp. RerS4]UQW99271.1 2OG-Fe(II) oxygenase [Streptomyces sp. RerS4]
MSVNPFCLSRDTELGISAGGSWAPTVSELPHVDAKVIENFLTSAEVELLSAELAAQRLVPTGRDGILAHYSPGDPVGSLRATAESGALAAEFYRRLQSCVSLEVTPDDPTDSDGRSWNPLSVNPRMRFIRYERGGLLVPHYDAPYRAPDGTRTLLTVVIYLSYEAVGGETRFIADKQNGLPFAQRDFSDWQRIASPEEILTAHHPVPGDALLFWHRTLHDSAPLLEGTKTILRTDVLYEPTGPA